jgi:L-ascorbate metabolism protein UlaG (beta-lactamase superfamily)
VLAFTKRPLVGRFVCVWYTASHMIITYHGAGCFRLSVGSTTVVLGPIAKESSWKHATFGADIAVVPLQHPDTNGVAEVTYGGKVPFAVDGPGEYEIAEVLIKGYPATSRLSGAEEIATSYLLRMEKMTLLYLGPVGTPELHSSLKQVLEDVDILFVPVGGDAVLAAADAHKLTVQVEPKVVIPVCYNKARCTAACETFEKEQGGDVQRVGEKWTVKPKEIAEYTQTVVSFR